MGWTGGIMKDAVDRRLVLVGAFLGDDPTGVAVAVKSREVTARNLQPDAVAWQEHICRGPQVEPQLIHLPGFHEFRLTG